VLGKKRELLEKIAGGRLAFGGNWKWVEGEYFRGDELQRDEKKRTIGWAVRPKPTNNSPEVGEREQNQRILQLEVKSLSRDARNRDGH